MSEELTSQDWVASRDAWLLDVGLVRNGYGTYDVVARVDGSYANLEDARHFLALSAATEKSP